MLVNSIASTSSLTRYPASDRAKLNLLIPIRKTQKADIFFRGKTKNTESALKLIDHGESASNALIITLKNVDFESAVKNSVLHALEGTVPFVNIATKVPGLFNALGQWAVKDNKKRLKATMEQFFKNPNQRNLEAWQLTQATSGMDALFIGPGVAYNMYKKAVEDFRHASDYIVGHSVPSLLDQRDLEDSIRRKTTALACMFLFNNKEIDHCIPDKDWPSSYSMCEEPVSNYGKRMLGYFDGTMPRRFDLLTALKIADLYHTKFDKIQLGFFYNQIGDVVLKGYKKDRDLRPLLLLQAMLKQQFTEAEAKKYLVEQSESNWHYLHTPFSEGKPGFLQYLYFNSEEDIKLEAQTGDKFMDRLEKFNWCIASPYREYTVASSPYTSYGL